MDKLAIVKAELTQSGVPFLSWTHPRSGDPWVSVRGKSRWLWVTEEVADPGARGPDDPGGKTGDLMVLASAHIDDRVVPGGDQDADHWMHEVDPLLVAREVASEHFQGELVTTPTN
jgi:hypothetical protein